MKYNVGDKVKIIDDFSECPEANDDGKMNHWQGTIMTIKTVGNYRYKMNEDENDRSENSPDGWNWYDNMIEGLYILPQHSKKAFNLRIS